MRTLHHPALAGFVVLLASAFALGAKPRNQAGKAETGKTEKKHAYAAVNGLKMYYEIHGAARPKPNGLALERRRGLGAPDIRPLEREPRRRQRRPVW